jgi:hypothetical protein
LEARYYLKYHQVPWFPLCSQVAISQSLPIRRYSKRHWPPTHPEAEKMEMFLLATQIRKGMFFESCHVVLVLLQTHRKQGQFERIGCHTLEDEKARDTLVRELGAMTLDEDADQGFDAINKDLHPEVILPYS